MDNPLIFYILKGWKFMSSIELHTRIKCKRDSELNWSANNPVLLNGEQVIVYLDDGSVRIKIGDGNSTYNNLPFYDFIPTYAAANNGEILSIVNNKPTWIAPSSYQILPITQEAYDALETKDSNTLYIIEV